jgi:photosystem II stability/assembly factor-like uncharacterized protein
MRQLILLLISATAIAQTLQVQLSHTTESLRGVSAVSREIAWASGTHGTYLRTIDGGKTWIPAQVPDAVKLDFRAVVAFDANEVFLMSAGPGDQSRIYHTTDAGKHWQLQFTNTNPKGFFDSMVFWDRTHGIVLGDPIPDDSTISESSALKFELLTTNDGQTWRPIPPAQLPPAQAGEGAFAASNTCIAILTNSTATRVVNAVATPVLASKEASSISRVTRTRDATSTMSFVIPSAARSESDGKSRNLLSAGTTISAGVVTAANSNPGVEATTPQPAQPWKSGASAPRQPAREERASAPDPNIWFATGGKVARVFHSPDRGQTWQVSNTPIIHGPDSAGIFSIAFRDAQHGVIAGGDYKHPNADGPNLAFTEDSGKTWTLSPLHHQVYFSAAAYDHKATDSQRLFLVGQDFIFDVRPPKKPTRVSPRKNLRMKFNAAAPYPEGRVLLVGPKGTIASIP